MDKPQRTRDQLRIAISTRLALSSACRDGIEVSVFPTDDKGGWNAAGTSLQGPLSAHAECLRLLKIVVSALQAEFDLAPEPHSDLGRPRSPPEPPHFPTGESFDEVAKKITQVALALRGNIGAKPSTAPPSGPETPSLQSPETEDHPEEAGDNQEELQPVTPPAVEKTPIVESIYPEQPSGVLVALNHITIDQGRAEFSEFSTKVDDLLTLLRESNEFSGEVRDQLIAEILAGRALLGAPKVDPILLERFLANPLKYIAKKTSETPIGSLTVAMLMLLGKLTSWW